MGKRHRRLDSAVNPLVVAIDVGSTATRGDLFDATARPVGGGRAKVAHAFVTRSDGTVEIDPDQVVDEVSQVLTVLTADLAAGQVAGVALDTFASSLVGVDSGGHALTPCYTYADSRCAAEVAALRGELDEGAVQQRTGCRIHSSYLVPRLRWLRTNDRSTFTRVRRWLSLGEYVQLRLLGRTAAGTATAAWTGMLDRRTGQWDPELLAVAGIAADQLSEVRDPDRPFTPVSALTAQQWPALAEAQWFAPVADGFSSNLGVGATDASTIAVAAATSGAMRILVHDLPAALPSGLWCYRVDSRRSLLGGAVNDVGRLVSWLRDTLQLPPDDELGARLAAPPVAGTPLVLPYLSGERSTGWAAGARAALTGVSATTDGAALFRGALEGVALTYARIATQLAEVAGRPERILASGRVTLDLPDWLRILADVLAAPVTPVTAKRMTLRGTAVHALDVLAPDVPRSSTTQGLTRSPIPDHVDHYQQMGRHYDEVYGALVK